MSDDKPLNSVDELDMYLGNSRGLGIIKDQEKEKTVAKESDDIDDVDTSDDAPDEDLEDDIEDDVDDEDDDVDDSALAKKAENAEKQRAEMQSERDQLKAMFTQQQEILREMKNEISEMKNKTENQEIGQDVFTGDPDMPMTEGQIRKLLEQANKQSQQQKAPIGTDLEAQQMWANTQPDVAEVAEYLNKNQIVSDPELASMKTIEGRYVQVRNKLMRQKIEESKKEIKRLKKVIKKIKKGPLPTSGSGNAAPETKRRGTTEKPDILDNFFANDSW
jgi:hypothetical protein